MSLRLFTSLNWMVGTLALGGAILLPFQRDMQVAAAKTEAESAVDRIVKAERGLLDRGRSRLSYFRANQQEQLQRELKLNPPLSSNNFSYEVYGDRTNLLLIRAVTSQAALSEGRLPPLCFVYKAEHANELPQDDQQTVGGEWLKLSGQKAGLLALVVY
ncbi:MAG: hypothetical protein WCF85_05870 [Rhodospirillaceae bacterium]